MMIQAVIFDVYGTLLEVGPPPSDADARWNSLCREMLHLETCPKRLDFSVACSRVIARLHSLAQERGITRPEIHWPSVVAEVLPEISRLEQADREEFLFRQIKTGHTTRMAQEVADMLGWLKQKRCCLGLASNAQAYTLRELTEGLGRYNLDLDLFEKDLCFWSFEHGFSKPDPHVLQILSVRLEARGIPPGRTLMVGDRFDNDIQPARLQGWQTWQLPTPGKAGNGNWRRMVEALSGEPASKVFRA